MNHPKFDSVVITSDPNVAGVTITRECVEDFLKDTLNDFEWLTVARDIDDILCSALDNYLEKKLLA